AAIQPAVLEGADAAYGEISGSGPFNVVQIFQEAVNVSYSRQGAYAQTAAVGGLATGQRAMVRDILKHQINLKLPKMRRDINYSFVRGTYALPANNLSA